jgi:hypothetical protein
VSTNRIPPAESPLQNGNHIVPLTLDSTPMSASSAQPENADESIVLALRPDLMPRSDDFFADLMPEPSQFNRQLEVTAKMLFVGNLRNAWAATKGTIIWMGVFYGLPAEKFGVPGYLVKNLAMGFFPNYFTKAAFKSGCLACGDSETKAQRRSNNYVKIYTVIDGLFQIQLDAIRYAETGKFVFFSENEFSSQEMLSHLAFTMVGFSLLFHGLTSVIEPEELNSKESAKIGPQYYALYSADSIMYSLSMLSVFSDMVLDLTAAPVITGLACFTVNFSLDLLQLYHERRQRAQAQAIAEMHDPVVEVQVDEGADLVDGSVQYIDRARDSSQSHRPGCGEILFGYAKSACCFFFRPPSPAPMIVQAVPAPANNY